MKRIALALFFALFGCYAADAQSVVRVNAQAVATCGGQSLTAGIFYPVTIDLTGTLCVASGAGGITAAVTVANGADVAEGNTADAAATAGGTGTVSAKLRLMTTQLGTINTTLGSPFQAGGVIGALPAGTARVGYTSDDPCTQKTKTTAAFTTSSGGPVSIVALSGSTVIYVCSISAIADTAIKLSFIDGTGGSCASAQHAIWGSTTAANGMSLAANGGFTMGSGNGSVGVTTAASAFCLLQSGTSLVAGNITYVQQ